MDIDTLKLKIQEFFQEDTVTIVGSGLSSAEGIPGMGPLAKELCAKIPAMLTEAEDTKQWEEIGKALTGGIGLEDALHLTKASAHLEKCIQRVTTLLIGAADQKVFEELIQGTRELRFSKYLNQFQISNQGMTVITTNYDRLIEYACEVKDITVDTLFTGKYLARFQPEKSKYASCTGIHVRGGNKRVLQFAPRVTVLKPHGCLSWHMIQDVPYSIMNVSMEDSLIITPGANKYREGYVQPFDMHRNQANAAIDKAQRYIIIGYGFADEHLETHLRPQLKKGKPAILFTYALSDNAKQIVKECENVIAVCCEGKDDTKVMNSKGETVLKNVNLWDLGEMIQEVFGW